MTARTGFLKCDTITCMSCRLSGDRLWQAGVGVGYFVGFRISSAMEEFGRSRTWLDFMGHDPKGAPP